MSHTDDAATGPDAHSPVAGDGQVDAHEGALQELLASPLLAGPDPEVVTDIKTTPEQEREALAAEALAEAEVAEIYRQILARAPEHDFDPKIARVARACELMGDPQQACPVVHITGTNGKTSTARIVEALLLARGLRVGRFTSPHLHDVRERICIDGEPIAAEAFVAAYRDVEPYLQMVDEESQRDGGPRLSFFEVFTLMAFTAFADAPVDVMVLEVGMGGSFDATNVADGDVAVITPIAREHERYLGSTPTEIAATKAGIIKPGAQVICAAQEEQVFHIIADAAAKAGARLWVEGTDMDVVQRDIAVGGQALTLRTPAAVYEDIPLALHGEHQAHNALLALAAVEALFAGRALDGGIVEQACASVRSPGRLEVVRTSPTIVVDAGHNPHGVEATVATLEETFGFSRLVAVTSALADKNVEAMLAALEPHVEEVVLTSINSPRALDIGELTEIATDVFGADRVHVQPALPDALQVAADLAESGSEPAATTGVLVIGSVYLAAAAREVCGKRKA